MKPEQQIKALAELDGWSVVQNDWKTYNAISPDGKVTASCNTEFEAWISHSYLTSYDAIIPLIQRLGKDVGGRVWVLVAELNLTYTPAQLCEALLRATGKWIEL